MILKGYRVGKTRTWQSVVYFVEAVGSGRVKIGTSINVPKRMSQLSMNCPFPLSLIGTIRSRKIEEVDVHRLFARFRLHGEWFELNDDIRAFISEFGK